MRRTRRALLLVVLIVAGVIGAQRVSIADSTPMRIVVLVDSSSTMASMLIEFRAALTAFADTAPADAELALISTGGQLRIRVPPTADRERFHKAAAAFASDGGANAFLDTLLESDKRFLRPAPNRKPVFVILTTDVPSRVDPNVDAYNAFVNDFRGRRGRAYGIVIRTGVSGLGTTSEFVDNLTRNTGGTMDVIAVSNGLADRMKLFAEALAFGR